MAETGRSGVVRARIADGVEVDEELVAEVRRLIPPRELVDSLSDAQLITMCVGLRVEDGRHIDEGALVELAFHKFAGRFAYAMRPEFPDVEVVRRAIGAAQQEGFLDSALGLTPLGRKVVANWQPRLDVRLDSSQSHAAGDLIFAERIEKLPGFQAYTEQGTLVLTKADELYRALRVPPTVDPEPVTGALVSRIRALRRVDRTDAARYLIEVARKHNPDVLARALAGSPELFDFVESLSAR